MQASASSEPSALRSHVTRVESRRKSMNRPSMQAQRPPRHKKGWLAVLASEPALESVYRQS